MDDIADMPDLPARVAAILDLPVEGVDKEGSLIEMGIDSITMMRLAAEWRRQGYSITFAEMVSEPSLGAWLNIIGRSSGKKIAVESEEDREETAPPLVDGREPFELALMQHAYWVGREDDQNLGGVAAHFYNEFDGAGVEPAQLEIAVRELIERHGMLRVRITGDGQQRIASASSWPGLTIHDFRSLPAGEVEEALEEMRQCLSHRRMDLAAGEVFDVQLSLLPDALRNGGTRVHFNLDMIAADALSLRLLLNDLACLYAKRELPPLHYTYPGYLADLEAALGEPGRAEALVEDRSYWKGRLEQMPAAPRLPVVGAGELHGATRVVRRHQWLPPEKVRAFELAARRHSLTPAMALAAVFAEVLTAWSAEPDFLLNLPLFNREPLHPEVDLLVGDFTSSVLLEWRGAKAGSFAERAAALQRRFHEDVQHGGLSGVEVLRELGRHHGEQRLAPVVYTSALGLGELFSDVVQEIFGRPAWIISQGPQVWLDAQVTELDGGLLVNLDAREDAFEPGVLDGLFAAHERLIEELIEQPQAWGKNVPSLLPEDTRRRRAEINATAALLSGWRLHDGFLAQAEREPQAPALLWGEDGGLTYGGLRRRAMEVAGHLVAQGVEPGEVVALSLPKGPQQIIAALGILIAGAAYLPIGMDQPVARRQRILQSSGAHILLEALPERADPLAQPVSGSDGDLAYILYTSGSTGEPKGVEVSHRAAMNTIEDLNRRLGLSADDRILALSALEFDLSVFDIFAAFAVGAAVVCVEERERRDARAWNQLIRRHDVTLLNCVPALLDMLLSAEGEALPLRAVLLGGDRIPPELPGRLAQWTSGCRFIALGGTTETAIHSTIFEVTEPHPRWHSAPYGKPLDNVRLRVVDALGRDCPDWVAGELWIGGEGVARGYRGDPERSAHRFVTFEGIRWYRTGDGARYRADGNVEFLGRLDHQVKLRGRRIELGEVEAALASAPGIETAAAVVVGQALVGVVTPKDATAVNAGVRIDLQAPPEEFGSLRDHLRGLLPPYMQPLSLYCCEQLPLSGNGKIDRKALARIAQQGEVQVAPDEFVPPQGELERALAGVWCRLLELPRVGREQNFFALGGDSLLATRMVRQLGKQGIGDIRLAAFFEDPVLYRFAATLKKSSPEPAREWRADKVNRYRPFPPTEVQRAYWIGRDPGLPLGGVACHFYREYDTDAVDIPRLEKAVDALVRRHEMLRAVFDQEGNQSILTDVPPFSVGTVSVDENGWDGACEAMRTQASHRVFDPARWPLFDICAVTGPGRTRTRTRLAISLDNLILDALSILMFYAELNQLYLNPSTVLPPISLSFRDYRLNSTPSGHTLEEARQFWSRKLPQLPPAPQLPLARGPEEIGTPRFARCRGELDAATWASLANRARQSGVTASALLLTAFAEVLGRWSQSPHLTLNLTLFDREECHPDIHRIMGDFTSLTLLGYCPRADESWRQRLCRTQGELGAALDHRALSSVTLLRELARDTGAAMTSMPVVFTSALGVPGGTAAPADGLFRHQVWGITQTPQVWLDHQVVETDGGIALNWDFVEGLFPEGLVAGMFDAYLRLLRNLAEVDWQAPPPDLMPQSQRAVRRQVNATSAPLPTETLQGRFFELARRQGEATALRWGRDAEMSYAELAQKALRLAALLERSGTQRGELVAVHLPKGPEQIAAVLGVLAAGAAYLPLGMEQPATRLERVLHRADVRTVVTESECAWPRPVSPCRYSDALSVEPLTEPLAVDPRQLAYVIFTSGSTGEPKGVEITHCAALNTVLDVNQRFGVSAEDRLLAVSALDFDLSVYDIFGPLSAGASLILVEEAARREARDWHRLAQRHGATIWNSAPALLEMLLTVSDPQSPPGPLRLALASGDWIGLDLPGRLAECCPGAQLIALGGATEASIWSNFFPVEKVEPSWRSIPYGWPLSNQCFRVVDEQGRDCPDWVAGELWIGGHGLAQGYRADPERSAESFVTVESDCGDSAGRWYRTGDRARYRSDGVLEFLGRIDGQVKIRGHRIELGEVEVALQRCPGVERAVVLATRGPAAAVRLVAAILQSDAKSPPPDETHLRELLMGLLPPQMLPEQIQFIESLPLTANGKVDRSALLEFFSRSANTESAGAESPRGEWEERVAQLWQELLETPVSHRQQSFFELGGDSLLATRFAEILRRRNGITLPLRTLFIRPRLAQVAAAIETERARSADMEEGVL